MAFRHYGGRVPIVTAPWKCPSCGAENLGPLEAACQLCGVGKDGAHVGQAPPPPPAAPALSVVLGKTAAATASSTRAEDEAFTAWVLRQPVALSLDGQAVARRAFLAGVDWARGVAERFPEDPRDPQVQQREATPAPSGGGAQLYITTPQGWLAGGGTELVEDRTLQTILAALIFYRDNQLGYGAVPGQLDAQEVSVLVARLTPAELPPFDPDIPF